MKTQCVSFRSAKFDFLVKKKKEKQKRGWNSYDLVLLLFNFKLERMSEKSFYLYYTFFLKKRILKQLILIKTNINFFHLSILNPIKCGIL